jgi:serine/threonine protein phosphatase 1
VACVEPFLPLGRRLYCIGDIHGRLDLLEELHELIRANAAGFQGRKGVIYLGDYIDRGAQSKQVLDLLIEHPLAGFDAVHLLGNHEQAMLDFLANPRAAAIWLNFGGQATLMSYGVSIGRLQRSTPVELLHDELEQRIPRAHLDFLASCRLLYTEGSYCFVHAGIRPGVALENQAAEDLLWIRDAFTRSRVNHGCIVVHGHNIAKEAEFRPNRIGIDTGAFHSGLLTALVLEGGEQRLLQTGRRAR